VRLSIVLLLIALAGIIGGAALIGIPAIGGAIIFDSLCVGLWALERDDGEAPPQAHGLPSPREVPTTLNAIFERARAAR
jgi:hypothetical protein